MRSSWWGATSALDRPDRHRNRQRTALVSEFVPLDGVQGRKGQIASRGGSGRSGRPACRAEQLRRNQAASESTPSDQGIDSGRDAVVDEPDRKADRIGERERPGGDGAVNALDVGDRVDQCVRCQPTSRQLSSCSIATPGTRLREPVWQSAARHCWLLRSGSKLPWLDRTEPAAGSTGAGAVIPSGGALHRLFRAPTALEARWTTRRCVWFENSVP